MAAKKRGKGKPTAFVLDGSVALAWFFEDETVAYAETVQDSLTARSPWSRPSGTWKWPTPSLSASAANAPPRPRSRTS